MSEPLKVFQGGALVGVLDKGDGEPFYGFTYDEAYLKMSSTTPLSLSLPLSARRYTGHEAMPFFEGLLPEGDIREAVARQFHVSALRPVELICVLGKDCAGDVVVLGEDDSCDLPEEAAYVPLPNALEEIARYPYGAISQLRAEYRLSLAGGQEKIALFHDDRAPLAEGWFAPLAGAQSSHIIKPQATDRFPLLALNEFMCMEAARAMGFEVPDTALVPGEHPLFVVRRYDRERAGEFSDGTPQVLRRVHQEDFCQAIGLTSGEKYETQKPHHAQDMRQPKRVAAKILEELASSLEAAFEAAAIESARVGLADDAHDLTQRIVRSTAKRKGVMRKAADLLG